MTVQQQLEFSMFDIKYKCGTLIKAQALADFLTECGFKDKGLELELH